MMVLCLDIRLSRKTSETVGEIEEPDEMFWLESLDPEARGNRQAGAPEPEGADEDLRSDCVKWYKLSRVAYLGG